jgi:hypothetical protein
MDTYASVIQTHCGDVVLHHTSRRPSRGGEVQEKGEGEVQDDAVDGEEGVHVVMGRKSRTSAAMLVYGNSSQLHILVWCELIHTFKGAAAFLLHLSVHWPESARVGRYHGLPRHDTEIL